MYLGGGVRVPGRKGACTWKEGLVYRKEGCVPGRKAWEVRLECLEGGVLEYHGSVVRVHGERGWSTHRGGQSATGMWGVGR